MKHIFTPDEIKEAASSFIGSDLEKQKYARAKKIIERDKEKLQQFTAQKLASKKLITLS